MRHFPPTRYVREFGMTIEIHPDAKISTLADIEDSVRGTCIVIGPRSTIDSFVKIKPAGGSGGVFIGSDSKINSGCVIYTGNGVQIGNGVLVAANTTFASTNHVYERRDIPIFRQGHAKGLGIIIEDDVWIGANCVILDGAYIGKGAIVAAGSVVRGKLESYCVYGGIPARKIKDRP